MVNKESFKKAHSPVRLPVISTGLPLTAPARTRMERGVAYWVRLRDVTGCTAPFTISGLGNGLIDFSTNGVTQDFTLVNNSTSAVQVVLSTASSEAPPTGQPGLAGPVAPTPTGLAAFLPNLAVYDALITEAAS